MKRILIAEDTQETRELLEFAFEDTEYDVITVSNGQELLDKVNEVNPDLIMPRLDGYSTALALKNRPETKNIPILISSGKSRLKDLEAFQDNNLIVGFIEKPYQLSNIINLVKEILENPKQK